MGRFDRLWIIVLLIICGGLPADQAVPVRASYVQVLGVAQDGGYPHAGCQKPCCRKLWSRPGKGEMVTALALVIPEENRYWLFEATPDFPRQSAWLRDRLPAGMPALPAGIFITHAHIGHYAGLMWLGREAMGARSVPVHALPRLTEFLARNGPWCQLVSLNNIILHALQAWRPVALPANISVTPIPVPHRDEFSETAGFLIAGPTRKILFIPDIDKWERWDQDICSWIARVDVAYVDGTFFDAAEISGRAMSEIPHPFIVESIARFKSLSAADRKKIRFIHLNHTNPAIDRGSPARRRILEAGLGVALFGERSLL